MSESPSKYVLGVDIGNSKTSYALAGMDGAVHRILRSSGANYQEIGRDEMVTRLTQSITQIIRQQAITLEHLGYIYYGAAGADTAEDFSLLRRAFSETTPNTPFDFDNDGWIALHSGTAGKPGMVVTCGTGNTNFAVNRAGVRMRIGGLEEMLGDRLGAPAICGYALAAARRSEDGRDEPTILTRMLPAAFGLRDTSEFINLEKSPSFVEKVISVLFEAAQQGDGKSLQICWELAREVMKIVCRFYDALFQEEKQFTLVLEGSFFKARYQPLMTMLELALHQRYSMELVIPNHEPVVGAVLLALRGCGTDLTPQVTDRVIRTYHQAEKSL
ncbi:MAG TPA: BadF/BadG/BcrA/BcrD ATPase family protein [bacterium]|nr:BadF/BadG/BcrA/BcrD ATPase family protein [bacterium]